VAKKRRVSRAWLRENIAGFLFILPWIIGFLGFELGPVIAAVYLSLTKYKMLTPPEFIGLTNYETMFVFDPLFWQSLKVTVIYSFATVFLSLVLGLSLALLLNQKVRGLAWYRTIYYMPAVVSGAAVAYMWRWVLNPQSGILNTLLGYIGIQGPNYLYDLNWVLPTFVLMSLWGVGGTMVLYLAALQGVPTALYDAAMIDGAGIWAKFRNVTLPMVSPVIFFNFIMGIIGSFQVFTGSYILTKGGPGHATLFYVLYLYRQAFENFKMGYAAALAMVLFVIIMALTALSFRVSSRYVYYEGQLR
jgi:multiple sugar transport system permease protein